MPRKYESDKPADNQRVPSHTRDEAWTIEFLKRAEIGHIAHSQGDQPFITPTNFWFDEANHRIIFHSNIAGRQRYNMENNPKVSMEASEYGRFLAANTALEFG
ncbi:MAG: pyridoxamine 5'-phosphate oxidase family protein, partial [Chloroflexota bacterium]